MPTYRPVPEKSGPLQAPATGAPEGSTLAPMVTPPFETTTLPPLPTVPVRSMPRVYDWLREHVKDDEPVLEIPAGIAAPRGFRYRADPEYLLWSLYHRRTLVNGYSGFLPTSYGNTLIAMKTFPDENSIGRLRRLSVDFVVVRRCNFLDDASYAKATAPLLARRDFGAPQVFGTGPDEAAVFALRPQPE